jgi:hypothetical protein
MIQLTYHAAFDVFHAVFRQFKIRELLKEGFAVPEEQIRIVDFYLVFPSRLGNVRLPKDKIRFRKLLTKLSKIRPYSELPEDSVLFSRMRPIQEAAFHTLSIADFSDRDARKIGVLKRTSKPTPQVIETHIAAWKAEEEETIELFRSMLTEFELLGENGLKSRSGLGEYRYDAV